MFRSNTILLIFGLAILLSLEVRGSRFSFSFLKFPSLSSLHMPSFSLPSLPFSLPFGFRRGVNSSSSSASHNTRLSFKKCAPAAPPVTRAFEKDFEQCRKQVVKNRKPGKTHPDQNKKTNEMIESYGYDFITYENVTTDDGYILTVFRITGGPKSPTKKGKPAVLLQHGLLTASDSWLLQPGDRNLAFKLADAGYDVWLANARGTTYSQRHVVFTPSDDTYWDFGLHEIGMYDIPAQIRIMLLETGQKEILFVGHSMGCTVIAIALAEMPELNSKVKAVVMLAPAVFIGHAYNPLRSFTKVVGTPIQDWIYHALEGYFDGDKQLENFGLSPVEFCTPTAIRCGVCDNLIFFMYGYDASQANYTNLPNVLSKLKNVVSLRTVIHFAQNLLSCQFRQYSYGFFGNFDRYGWYQPPAYNLKAIKTPVYVFHGESDNLVPPVDVELIQEAMSLDTVKGVYKVDWPTFNHVDFVVANDADILVYDKILHILDNHTYGKREAVVSTDPVVVA